MRNSRWVHFFSLVSAICICACSGASTESAPGGDPQPEVIAVMPAANEASAPLSDPVTATFDQVMGPGDAATFVVHGSFTGRLTGVYSGGGTATLAFDPAVDFKVGEEIEVILTDGLSATTGTPARPFVYRFRAETLLGSGNFAIDSTVAGQDDARAVIAGDWNADGSLDLAVANFGDSSVSILTNNGSGSFADTQTLPGLTGAAALAAGDWNADGSLDLAVANFGDNSVSILANNGLGSFASSQTLAGLTGATALAAGDWNADGSLDLAVANFGDSSVSILANNGLGSFASSQTLAGLTGATALAAGDWNADSRLDLASANSGNSSVGVLLNQP
ncbi:MAG: FG-GAP-like repeat-containing protein [Desulfobacterales bacterium]